MLSLKLPDERLAPRIPPRLPSNFPYQLPVVVDNTGNASTLTNYQVKVTVLWKRGLMREDFADIRFTDKFGNPLSYWVETKTDGISATIWVKVASILGSAKTTIYLRCGNPNAASESSGDDTFIFFDDFPGTSLDTNKWTTSDSERPSESGYTISVSDSKVYLLDPGGGYHRAAISTEGKWTTTDTNLEVRLKRMVHVPATETAGYCNIIFGLRETGVWTAAHIPNIHWEHQYRHLHTYVGGSLGSITESQWQDAWKIHRITRVGTSWEILEDDTSKRTGTYSTSASQRIIIESRGYQQNTYQYVDWVFVRNFTSPEPTTSIGEPEARMAYLNPENYWLPYVIIKIEEYLTASARASVPIAYGEGLYKTADARATTPIVLRQVLHVPAIADSRVSATFIAPWVLFLTAEARAAEAIALRQILHVPAIAEARATDIVLPLQALLLYPTAEARAEAPPAYGWGFEQLARARATELIALRQVLHIPIAAEAKAADLVSPSQLLHLYLPAVAKATDLVAPSQLLRIYKIADTRASALFATRQFFRVSEPADVRATDLFEVKKGITALFTAAVKASAPVTLRQLLRAYLIASAKVSAPKTGKRKHPDYYMPTICLWYFDIDTGEVLPETFE